MDTKFPPSEINLPRTTLAKNTAIGAWSRISVFMVAVWCSVTCCTWVKSTPRRQWSGARPSRCWTRMPGVRERWRCFPKITVPRSQPTLRWCSFGCPKCSSARPRQWGACWLSGQLWRELRLDRFWSDRLPRSRKGTRWDQVLQVLACYRLIAPGSEWKLHREWMEEAFKNLKQDL